MKFNDAGQFYPLWGTCLGFERLAAYTANIGESVLERIEAKKVNLPIFFTKNPD